MPSLALVGDRTTTTALAIAATWPEHGAEQPPDDGVMVVEADPTGGSLAAWLDVPPSPSLSTIVSTLHQLERGGGTTHDARWERIAPLVRRSRSNVQFIAAPYRSKEARSAVAEADHALLPTLARRTAVSVLDVGRVDPHRLPRTLQHAQFLVVCHRQDPATAASAAVRLERLAEAFAAAAQFHGRIGLAVIGDRPFALDEIVAFVGAPRSWQLAEDPLAAATLAGRPGVSARRLARLPLLRSAALCAADLGRLLTESDPAAPLPPPDEQAAHADLATPREPT